MTFRCCLPLAVLGLTLSAFPAQGQPISSSFGWLYLNLNHASLLDSSLGPGYVGVAQAWVETIMGMQGRPEIQK